MLTKAVTYYWLDHINLKKVKQNNGKEDVIIRLNRTMEQKNVFKHIIQGYILPKDKQSMISMTGYNVENPLGKGRQISWRYPYDGVWIIDQEKLSIAFQIFLLMNGVPQTCFEIALTWSSGKGQTLDTQRIHQEQLVE